MAQVAQPGTPVSIPYVVPVLLCPVLILWIAFLARRRSRQAWPCSLGFGLALIPGCLFADAAALLAAMRWPSRDSNGLVFTLLWIAAMFSVTAYFALRTPNDAGGDDGGEEAPYPEPPWWPEFERDLRDYMRRGPGPPARPRTGPDRPRTPA